MSKLQRVILKLTLFIVSLLPLAWLVYGLFNDQLGANPIEVVTRSLGEWGLMFLVATLCMTPLKDAIGRPWPILIRRMLGLFSFFYILLHLFSYLWFDQFFDWAEIGKDIIERPYITFGMLAFIGLVPLALTSNRWSQRRLGKRWKSLHRWIYWIVPLGVVHFYLLVKLDTLRPWLFACCVLLLLVYRLIKTYIPAAPMGKKATND